jgi:hypothetical protein
VGKKPKAAQKWYGEGISESAYQRSQMKNIIEILHAKLVEFDRVKHEVECLRLVIPMLVENEAELKNRAPVPMPVPEMEVTTATHLENKVL